MSRILSRIHLEAPPPEVYAYVTAPGHWPQWHPSSLGVRGALSSLEVGQEVTEAFQVAGRKGEVVWRCTARQVPARWVIEGKIVGRSAGGTITYMLRPEGQGTHFEREFVYTMPTAFLRLLDTLVFRRRVEAESQEALRRLKARLESRDTALDLGTSAQAGRSRLISWAFDGLFTPRVRYFRSEERLWQKTITCLLTAGGCGGASRRCPTSSAMP